MNKYIVSGNPHNRAKDSIQSLMLDVLIAMLPAAVMAAFYFGVSAIIIMAVSVASCCLFEYLYQKATKKTITVTDLSAAVTGLLLAFNLPASVPIWIPIVGSFFAIIIVKQIFGGLGQNFLNPALAARGFLLASYPLQMTTWTNHPLSADVVSQATPLALLKAGYVPEQADYILALFGIKGGCIGEVCTIAIIIGGLYMIVRRVITWRIPVTYLGSVLVLSFVFGRQGMFTGAPVFELLAGGVMLGAFFMATDYTTSPSSPKGHVIYGIGCGITTVVVRHWGAYPEGVTYAILLMNLAVPLIDRFTVPRVFGRKAGKHA